MVYITVKQPPMYHQMSLEDFLSSSAVVQHQSVNPNLTNTRTYEVENVSSRFANKFGVDIEYLTRQLERFNERTQELREQPRKSLYREFYIPKKSGGLRKIDAPNPELMDALRNLKTIFEEDFKLLYHTSAFAYIRKRSTLDAVKRHQANESRWFAKYDLSNFFGNTTLNFVVKMFSMVYPVSEVVKTERGLTAFKTAIELAFLSGGLPQGTPISPIITNVMMIPVDFKLTNTLRDFNKQKFTYTRYADDFLVSSRYDFKFREVEKLIVDTLKTFDAPFTIKAEKTRYGNRNGQNWNLGVMLNADNQITIGHKRKRQFQAMLTSFVLDTKNGNYWEIGDVQQLDGFRNYYRMVERDTIDAIVKHLGDKFGVDIPKMIKQQLRVS